VTQNLPENLAGFEFTQTEGMQSILTLMNLIPDPAVIYNRLKDEIRIANNPLYLLTNLGENDLLGKPIKSILPNLNDTDPVSGHNKPALLRHKKQPLIPVTVRIFTLSSNEENELVILKPEEVESHKKSGIADQAVLIENLQALIRTRENQDLKTALMHVLELSETLLGADVVCLYKASGTVPQLVPYLSNNNDLSSELPNRLTSEDLVNSQRSYLWTSDLPAMTQLQKTAASSEYKFLAIVPLGQGSAKFGLFIAGGKSQNDNSNTLSLAKLIAAYTAGLMEDQIALHNARNLTKKIKQVVKIQNEIISNLDEGVIILSPDLTVAEINPAAENILGYANVEALRQHIDSILIGSESLGAAFTSARQGIPTLTSGDLTLHHRSGHSFPAQVMTAPVMSNGKLLSIIILIRDMSQVEQNQAVKTQLEQRAILGEVTAIFAHEVRNPINAIMLSLQVMADNLAEDDENHKWIDNMRDECNKLMYLMESVLSFAKPLEYKMSGINLDSMLPRLLERWHPRLLRLNISSYYESEIDDPIVEGDLRALEQVFTNLISNAVNAMSENGGSLGIKVSETENEEDVNFLQITLTDSGRGIPDEIKAHMFQPFVTGSSHGTGLGLAITQRIVTAHKGKIEVDSFAGGTIFKIYLVKKKGLTNP